ncbi:unnamed protein product [Lepeophtheirus salmonis]|uniref:(salmon louse) hypothetical protein n=1 Tax=Lepeophtheirus salmonis TaxID=72036 RepID=A0A817FDG4_LEPSM|nr:unnamed protein product [Lepeophtheirus salmonis]
MSNLGENLSRRRRVLQHLRDPKYKGNRRLHERKKKAGGNHKEETIPKSNHQVKINNNEKNGVLNSEIKLERETELSADKRKEEELFRNVTPAESKFVGHDHMESIKVTSTSGNDPDTMEKNKQDSVVIKRKGSN